MTATLQKIEDSLFPKAHELLVGLNNGYLTQVEWRNLFTYKWEKEEEHCGYALVDGPEVVGFIGMIFRSRVIRNKVEKFCNITSWIVKEQYRDKSLLLVMPLSKMKNYTITDLSPTRNVSLVLRRLGFKELEANVTVLLPFGMSRRKGKLNGMHIARDNAIIKSRIKGTDVTIFSDHIHYKCGHLLIYGLDEYCYVIYTRVRRHMIPYCCIQYISNADIFVRYNNIIRGQLLRDSRALCIVLDSRFVSTKRLRYSAELPLRTPKLYRSNRVSPEEVDNLYSEAIVLNAGTVPHGLRLVWVLWKNLWVKGDRAID